MTYTVLDLETTVAARYKRKATPFGGLNFVVMEGHKDQGAESATGTYYGSTGAPPGWLIPLIKNHNLLVGFNIKFDLLHALQDELNLRYWMEWVSGGGRIWDCQLAEYLLNGMGQKDQMLSLDEVAPRYGGTVKLDEVKILWEQGVDTHEIPREMLETYLLGGEAGDGTVYEGDVANTERVMLGQVQRAKEAGQLKSIMLNMGALLATIEIERNGMFVDLELGMAEAARLTELVAAARESLQSYVPKDMPIPFNWGSRFHKSMLIFGGKVKYPRREYLQTTGEYVWEAGLPTQEYAQREETHVVLESGKTMPVELWEHLQAVPDGTDTTPVRYKGGKNAGELKLKKVKVPDLTKPKSRMGSDWYSFDGYTQAEEAWKTSDPGVYSVSDDVITALGARDVPFTKALASLTAMAKDLGTYYITTDEDGKQRGMLTLVDPVTGLIHHKLNHTTMVTARLSCSDPNLQNLPRKGTSNVKKMFKSRFKGGVIIQSDFSSLEVYVQAILTRASKLIDALRKGLDMHVKRLAAKEGIPYEECLLKCKGDPARGISPEPGWPEKRTGSKEFSFQRAYGAGVAAIAASTGMDPEDVRALIEVEDAEYPEVGVYYNLLTARIESTRRPLRVVPHPDLPGALCHLGYGFSRTPDGKLYRYEEAPTPSFMVVDKHGNRRRDAKLWSFSPTEIRNYEVQGTGAEWMKAALYLLVMEFYRRRNFDGRALLVNTVHDATYCDAQEDVKHEAARVIHACMLAASDYMAYRFDWDIPVPVPSETTWGPTMADEAPVPDLEVGDLRAELRARYMAGFTPAYLQ